MAEKSGIKDCNYRENHVHSLLKRHIAESTDCQLEADDGRPIGTEEYLLPDILTWEYEGINIK